MKKKLFLTAILTLICCTLLIAGASADYSGQGSGTAADPYLISNAAQLKEFAGIVSSDNDACAKLTADITVNTGVLGTDGNLVSGTDNFRTWTLIGDSSHAYSGTFDGQGHTVSGLSLKNAYAYYAGLFGYVGSRGAVKNVSVVDSSFTSMSSAYAGGICGLNNGGTIENCYTSAELDFTAVPSAYLGNSDYDAYAGGVCGQNNGKITNCFNSGSVTATVGAGFEVDIGGVCGYNSVTITNCFNSGTVTCEDTTGGVCGRNYNGTVTNCYWLEGKAEDDIVYGTGEATSKTADEFASGEVAWLLNKGQTNGPWRQNLGEGGDAEPVLDATHSEVICIYIDNTPVYANPGSVTLPDPEPGKAYFDETGKYVDPETCVFTDGMCIHLEDVITASFVYGDGTSVAQMVKEDTGSVVMPDAPSKPGYIFMGWRSGDMTYQPGDEVGLYGDTTFTAVWANMPDITPTEPVEPVEPTELPFTDVPASAWYYDAVKTVYEAGLMNGVTDTEFDPDGTLNRAMFWTILARASGVDTDGGATWYAVAQQWAIDNGVSDGTDAMGALTREQLVTMLWRLTAPDAGQISTWALEAMRWAASTGLIQGDESGNLTPTATCTRAQAATFLVRYLTVG